jgi:hypothetical protein
MEYKAKTKRQPKRYRRVQVTDLNRKRKGKHHELIQGILKELRGLEAGAALEIPLSEAGGVGLANLRSAVHRASISAGIVIETLSDEEHFYVWKKSKRDVY